MGLTVAVASVVEVLPSGSDITSRFATNPGDPVFIMWQLALQSHQLLHNPLSLMQGNIFWPHTSTIAYSDNLIGFLPVFAPTLWLSGNNPILAYNVSAVVFYWLSGLAVYALAAHVLAQRWAALVATVMFAALPYHLAALSHLQMTGFLFVPLALLCLMRVLEGHRSRDGALWGICAAGAWYTSLYGFEMLVLATAVFLLVWLVRHGRELGRSMLGPAVSGALFAAALIGPTLSAYLSVGRTGAITRSAAGLVTASPVGFVTLPPSLLYSSLKLAPPVLNDSRAFFPGAVLLLLGATGVLAGTADAWRRRGRAGATAEHRRGYAGTRPAYAVPLLAVAVVALMVMVGPNRGVVLSGGAQLFRAVIPGMASLRDLTRFWLIPGSLLAVAGGWGFLAVMRRLPGRLVPPVAVAIIVLACCETLFRPGFATAAYSGSTATANRVLATLAPGPTVELPLPDPEGRYYPYVVAPRQLRSGIDGFPRIEGYSGAIPLDTLAAVAWAQATPDPTAVEVLRHDGVRYIVLHGGAQACAGEYSTEELRAVQAALRVNPQVLRIIPASSDAIVILRPDPTAVPGSVPAPPSRRSPRIATGCPAG